MAAITAGSTTHLTLAVRPEQAGDTLSITLSEDPESRVQWRILIDTQTYEGRFRLGQLLTISPFGRVEPGTRVVGYGQCPGTIRWHITIFAANLALFPTFNGFRADAFLSCSSSPMFPSGVTPNTPGPSL